MSGVILEKFLNQIEAHRFGYTEYPESPKILLYWCGRIVCILSIMF